VVVAVDISGSMACAVTGVRKGATSKMRCVDVAALFSACILKKNPSALVLPFHGHVVDVRMNPRDSIMTNAEKLASRCNNGTDVAAPLQWLVDKKHKVDTIIYFSDNESWMVGRAGLGPFGSVRGTPMQRLYNQLRVRTPQMKMICVDLIPNSTLQATNSPNVLNVGGFSDTIFDIINEFVSGKFGKGLWANRIEQIELDSVDKLFA
jgi:60 kDa SS-A/Ro ribonucleoprotein